MWNWTSRTETNLQTADSAFCCHNITTSCFIFTDEESRLTPDSSGLLWRNWWRQTAMRWVSPTSTALTDGCSGFSKTYTFNFSSIASLSTSLNPEISRIQSVRASVRLSVCVRLLTNLFVGVKSELCYTTGCFQKNILVSESLFTSLEKLEIEIKVFWRTLHFKIIPQS